MSQVMKVQIVDFEHAARASKRSAYRLGLEREHSILMMILSTYNFPRLIRIFKSPKQFSI